MSFLRGVFARRPAIPQDTTAPNDITGFTATLSGTQVTVDSDPGVDPAGVGISGYHTQVSLNGTFSDAVDLPFSATTQQVYQGVPNTTPYFRRKAHKGNNGLESVNWVASTPTHVTIPNTLAADSTNPPKPSSAPTLLSHDSTNIAITLATVLDDTTNSATQIVTGVVKYLLKRNGTLLPTTYTNPVGPLAGIESITIGSPAIAGSYGVVSGTYTLVCGGENGWYGTTDQGRIASCPMQGDFTFIAKIVSVTSAYTWEKCGLIVQDGLAANAAYFAAAAFNAHPLNRESRAGQGLSATQDAGASTLAATPWVQITRVGNLLTAFYAADVAGSPGTFTQLGTAQTIAMSAIVEVGLFCSSGNPGTTTTAVFSGLSITGNPSIVVHDTGSPSTTYLYTYAAQDGQGNIGIYSDALSVTTDASGGTTDGSGLGQYAIGNQGSYATDAVINFFAVNDAVILAPDEGIVGSWARPWGTIVDLIHSRSLLPGGTQVGAYYDAWRGGISSSVFASRFNKLTANPTWQVRVTYPGGAQVHWAGDLMVNLYAGATNDGAGLNQYQWFARYFDDVSRTGNSHGTLTSSGNPNAANIDFRFSDDVFITYNISSNGPADFDRNGTSDPADQTHWTAIQAGQKQVQLEIDALWPAGKRWGNIPSNDFSNDTAYAGFWDGGIVENAIGDGACYESFGFGSLTTAITNKIARCKTSAPPLILIHNSVTTAGRDTTGGSGQPAYQAQRYGRCVALAFGLMYQANKSASAAAYDPNASIALWLDENAATSAGVCVAYASLTGAALRYRGPVQGTAPTTLSNGILRRDYLNCIVLVNTKGNGDRTFTLGGSSNFKRLTGTQDSTVNSGAAVGPSTSITMLDRSGLILMRA